MSNRYQFTVLPNAVVFTAGDSSITLESALALRLIHTRAFESLKHAGTNGVSRYLSDPQPAAPGHRRLLTSTRWEHSIFAAMVVQRAGGTEYETVVALLHDIMHTTFSHVADHLHRLQRLGGDETVSYHEAKKRRLLAAYDAELAPILGADWVAEYMDDSPRRYLVKGGHFNADNAAYTWLDSYIAGFTSPHLPKLAAEAATVDGAEVRRLVCVEESDARLFEELSRRIGHAFYESAWNYAANLTLARTLHRMMTAGLVTWTDLESRARDEAALFAAAQNYAPDEFAHLQKCEWLFFANTRVAEEAGAVPVHCAKVRYRHIAAPLPGTTPPAPANNRAKFILAWRLLA